MVTSSQGYDAFISYSHAHDGKLVAALHSGLERFAKRWYELRALRVFYDSASLSAAPELWGAVETALRRSSWFILLASVHAGSSQWVAREVGWWLEHRGVDRLLIVLTDGELDWSSTSTKEPVVPPVLRAALPSEPRWIDLRWVSRVEQLDPADPRFRDAIAEIGAPLHGVDKDLLVGAQLREHRRTMRFLRSGIAVLAVLALVAGTAAFYAFGQRNEARTQARIATSRQLAATARSEITSRLDLARLLAVQAYRTDRNNETRAAVLETLTASPSLDRFLPVGHQVSTLTTSSNGRSIVVGGKDGFLIRWDGLERRTETTIGHDPVLGVATSSDASTTVAVDATGAAVWTAAGITRLNAPGAVQVAISPSGVTIAVLERPTAAPPTLRVFNRLGRPLGSRAVDAVDYVAAPSDNELATISATGVWQRWNVPGLLLTSSNADQLAPAGGFTPAISPNGDRFLFAKNNTVAVYETTTKKRPEGLPPDEESDELIPTGDVAAIAINANATRVAVADAGTIYVSGIAAENHLTPVDQRFDAYSMTGTKVVNPGAMAFLGADGAALVSATNDLLTIWDFRSGGALRSGKPIDMPDGPTASPEPRIAAAGDTSRVAVVGPGSAMTADTSDGSMHMIDGHNNVYDYGIPLWSADLKTLYLAGIRGQRTSLTTTDTGVTVVPLWLEGDYSISVLAAALSPDNRQVVFVDTAGAVYRADTADGSVHPLLPGLGLEPPHGGPWPQATGWASISPDASSVARLTPQGVLVTDLATLTNTTLPGGTAAEVVFAAGRLLVERSNGSIEVWDARTLSQITTVPGDTTYERARTLSPDGNTAIRLDAQGNIVLTDIPTSASLGSLQLPSAARASATDIWAATSMALDPSGSHLFTATSGGLLVRWTLDESQWIPAACHSAGHDIDPATWLQLVGTEPPPTLACQSGTG